MRKAATLLVAVCLQGLVLAAMAQDQPGTVIEVIRIKPKPGMEKQFEAAGKEHVAWHRQKNDTWTWFVSQVMSGPRTGEYVAATPGHRWADFDTAPVSREEDQADAATRIGQYVDSIETLYVVSLPKHSRPTEATTPSKYTTLVTIYVKQGMETEYLNAVSKLPAAMEKTNWPGHYNFATLANGGEHPTFFLLLRRDKWADFAQPEKPFEKMLEDAYGRAEADSILKTLDKSTAKVSSEMRAYRPDLSYVPKSP
ncbi:MAG: hypothetical protein HYS61_09630 [Acidobacteria bacterium]|nr:hypothetical protein [Acidobacteriota bacterium]